MDELDLLERATAKIDRERQRTNLWPDPQPLPNDLLPVARFEIELLPSTLRPWALDIAERIQCAPDFVGVATMASLGAVIGRKLCIRPQERTDWTVVPNQWALVVGRPGVLKSPAMEAALAPLKRLARKATDLHRDVVADFKRAARAEKLRAEESEKAARKALAKDPESDVSHLLITDEPQEPSLRRYIANDSTAAALGELVRQNPNGLLVYRDELVSLLKSLDREDNAEARGFYLTSWNGDSSFTFDRIARGLNLHIDAVCLSVLGSSQPGRIGEYIGNAVKGGAADDGLIQRFGLIVWPDLDPNWRDVDRYPDGDASRKVFELFEFIDGLNPLAIGAIQDTDCYGVSCGTPYLRFGEVGQGLFREWRSDLEQKVRGGDLHPALESHLSKYRKLVPGLALICHVANRGSGPVTEEATLQALAWAEYLETHARRAYSSVSFPELAAAKAILTHLKRGDLSSPFSSRDVWRPGWAKLDRESVTAALPLLIELDWLRASQHETGGRPATVYEANPATYR